MTLGMGIWYGRLAALVTVLIAFEQISATAVGPRAGSSDTDPTVDRYRRRALHDGGSIHYW